jgi:hypothetical protein
MDVLKTTLMQGCETNSMTISKTNLIEGRQLFEVNVNRTKKWGRGRALYGSTKERGYLQSL